MASLAQSKAQYNQQPKKGDAGSTGRVPATGAPLLPSHESHQLEDVPSLLGNIQDCLPPPSRAVLQPDLSFSPRRELLFTLQEQAALLANSTRVGSCLRVPLNKFGAVEVKASPAGVLYLAGLFRCGLLWLCPACASKIAYSRSRELQQAIDIWVKLGHQVAMVTYTLRHDASMPLSDVVQALQAGQDRFTNGASYLRYKASWGVLGLVRALEVTVGDNGWHVHLHELLIFDRKVNWLMLESVTLQRWAAALESVGYSCNEHGLDVIGGDQATGRFQARYLSKFDVLDPSDQAELGGIVVNGGWSIAQEIALAVSKKARRGGRTPLQLLADSYLGDELAGALYQEYASVFPGKRHLRYSKGTRSLLGLDSHESTDDELANLPGAGSTLALISAPDWLRSNMGARRVELLRGFLPESEVTLDVKEEVERSRS